jgi:hypothetical protein
MVIILRLITFTTILLRISTFSYLSSIEDKYDLAKEVMRSRLSADE